MDQEIKSMLTQILDQLKVHDARFDKMDERMDMFQREIASLKEDNTTIKATMATKDDIAEIKATMATKSDIAEIWATMATKDDIAEVRDEMSGLHTKVDFLIDKSKLHDIEIWQFKKKQAVKKPRSK